MFMLRIKHEHTEIDGAMKRGAELHRKAMAGHIIMANYRPNKNTKFYILLASF